MRYVLHSIRPQLAIFLVLLAACDEGISVDQERSGVELSILTLNLHVYQEIQTKGVEEPDLTDEQAYRRVEQYAEIFDRIGDGIDQLDPDIICLQEVGEWPGTDAIANGQIEFGGSETNMLHQIRRRLSHQGYDYTMDWSHMGYGVWLEGAAVMSKQPINNSSSRYISRPENSRRDFWKSRNIPLAQIEWPGLGQVNVFSVHAGWPDDEQDPFDEQFIRLLKWVDELESANSTTVLCGDFNSAAGSKSHELMISGSGFSDQYLLANPDGMFDSTISGNIDGWEDNKSGQRIDYILINDDSPLQVKRSEIVFTEARFGLVSDHAGVMAWFGAAE